MNTNTLNTQFLTHLHACTEAIRFVENNNLTNFPLQQLENIQGDYDNYVKWITVRYKEWLTHPNRFPLYTILTTTNITTNKSPHATYDQNGNCLTYYNPFTKSSFSQTFDHNNNQLTYQDSCDIQWSKTYDQHQNCTQLTHSEKYLQYTRSFKHYDNGQLKSISQDSTIILHLPINE